jgi:hypothetical protein
VRKEWHIIIIRKTADGEVTKEQKKLALAGAAAAALVALATTVTIRTISDEPAVYSPPEWRNLTDEQREQKLDEEERKRRASGRGPSRRRLPEDPPKKSP